MSANLYLGQFLDHGCQTQCNFQEFSFQVQRLGDFSFCIRDVLDLRHNWYLSTYEGRGRGSAYSKYWLGPGNVYGHRTMGKTTPNGYIIDSCVKKTTFTSDVTVQCAQQQSQEQQDINKRVAVHYTSCKQYLCN